MYDTNGDDDDDDDDGDDDDVLLTSIERFRETKETSHIGDFADVP